MKDLFETPKKQPKDVKVIIKKYSLLDNSYENCRMLIEELNKKGYTCDYGLDAIPFDLKPIEGIKWARKCSVTGEGMDSGHFSDTWDMYFKYDKDAEREAKKRGYNNIKEAYKDDVIYWTEWEDEDDFCYQIINGILTEIQ